MVNDVPLFQQELESLGRVVSDPEGKAVSVISDR